MSVRQVRVHGREVWQATMRVAIVSIVILLVIASAAHAECAWVMWSRLEGKGRQTTLTPVVAFQSFAQCEAREAEMSAKPSDTARELFRDLGVTSLTYTCLPDTVNPRGPKAK
jgi:hypothetical protein